MPQVGPPVVPLRGDERSKKIQDRDFALYVDGNRITAKRDIKLEDDGITVRVTFTTSRGALDSPFVDPEEEAAWGGWKPGDTCHLFQPTERGERLPTNGFVQIHSVKRAAKAGDPTYFMVKAITPVYDHITDAAICEGGEYALIPTTWFRS